MCEMVSLDPVVSHPVPYLEVTPQNVMEMLWGFTQNSMVFPWSILPCAILATQPEVTFQETVGISSAPVSFQGLHPRENRAGCPVTSVVSAH